MVFQRPSTVLSAAFPEPCLELCEGEFNGIEVWTVRRQEEELRTGVLDHLPGTTGPLWLERLSMTTISPGPSPGTRTCLT